jgi:hypothetical protein
MAGKIKLLKGNQMGVQVIIFFLKKYNASDSFLSRLFLKNTRFANTVMDR